MQSHLAKALFGVVALLILLSSESAYAQGSPACQAINQEFGTTQIFSSPLGENNAFQSQYFSGGPNGPLTPSETLRYEASSTGGSAGSATRFQLFSNTSDQGNVFAEDVVAAPNDFNVSGSFVIPQNTGNTRLLVRADSRTNIQSVSYRVTCDPIATVPGAPVNVAASAAGDGSATVSFDPPASNGGAAVSGYTVTSAPGGITATGTASPITVTGLANGTAYTFTVTATNAAGTGPASDPSNSVTPIAPPVANDSTASVAANSTDNDLPLDITGGAAASLAITTGPANGTATVSGTSILYTPDAGYSGSNSLAYTATNASGTSAPATVAITVTAPTLVLSPATLPDATVGAPYSQTLTAANGTAPYSSPSRRETCRRD
ncbi:fibronectin type III domain-containing protein [Fulvimarina endophytica]|uniref:Fibronectin type III domain-containing protein n=1 Tax=Fulvimarina endophytica TaxID=2293836 RepID=A0A371WY39_9HYPH|nr:fibronectin type III domain-containing protein [Fulvimarina endophytica]